MKKIIIPLLICSLLANPVTTKAKALLPQIIQKQQISEQIKQKTKNYKVTYKVYKDDKECGDCYFQVEDQKIEFKFEVGIPYFLLFKKNKKCFIFSDPVKGIYKQNGDEIKTPKNVPDILQAILYRINREQEYQKNSIDTLDVFVDKEIKTIFIKRHENLEKTLKRRR